MINNTSKLIFITIVKKDFLVNAILLTHDLTFMYTK